jgi:hypothetical protein
MSYIVKQHVQKAYRIYDTTTDEYINLDLSRSRANQIARKLNLGSGFEGLIPDFFNKEHIVPYK